MKPLDPRLLKLTKGAGLYIASLVLLAILSAITTVGIAWNLAQFVVDVFQARVPAGQAAHSLWNAIGFAILRALAQFAQEAFGSMASQRAKEAIRTSVLAKRSQGYEIGHSGAWSYLLSYGLDSLDSYFAKFLPQLIFASLITPAYVFLLLLLDLPSGLVLVFTIPLIPLFMVLIGLVTKDVQKQQLRGLERLNSHFLEVLKGALTLKIFNRGIHQEAVLKQLADEHKVKTMKVLRVSFLSGFALELAASLSVALVAVTIGIRLVDGELQLLTGLFVLLIIPEAYLPLRQIGVQFHASTEALEVLDKSLEYLESDSAIATKRKVAVDFPSEKLVALVGRSGSGKSSLLRAWAYRGVWMPQQANFLPGTGVENITMFSEPNSQLLSEVVTRCHLVELNLQEFFEENPEFSGGELQRISLARAIYRQKITGAKVLLLDEPLSQQNPELLSELLGYLIELASSGTQVVIATHQPQIVEKASQVISLAT